MEHSGTVTPVAFSFYYFSACPVLAVGNRSSSGKHHIKLSLRYIRRIHQNIKLDISTIQTENAINQQFLSIFRQPSCDSNTEELNEVVIDEVLV